MRHKGLQDPAGRHASATYQAYWVSMFPLAAKPVKRTSSLKAIDPFKVISLMQWTKLPGWKTTSHPFTSLQMKHIYTKCLFPWSHNEVAMSYRLQENTHNTGEQAISLFSVCLSPYHIVIFLVTSLYRNDQTRSWHWAYTYYPRSSWLWEIQ